MSTVPAPDPRPWERYQAPALVAGAAGLVLCLLGAFLFGPAQFFRSYLVGYQFWLGIALGCLAILMLQHLTGGAWGLLLRRPLESGTRTLPLLALLFLPLLFGLSFLYLWALVELPEGWAVTLRHLRLERAYYALWPADAVVSGDAHLRHKSPYLNVPFFLVRAALYFATWLTLAYFLNKWSLEQDRTGDPRLSRRFRLLSAPGLALYGLTITFASIDWVMSLEPKWWSSIYGVMFGTGQVLAAFSFVLAAVLVLAPYLPQRGYFSADLLRDLGSLLLAFVMLWAYLALSQFLLIWYANLPEEIPWYLRRLRGGWQLIGITLVLFHFALPFVLLLSRGVKQTPRALAAVAGLVLGMRVVDLFWLIAPAFPPGEGHAYWMDFVAVLGVGGLWLAAFLRQLGRRPLMPARDPYLAEATHHA